MEEVPGGTIDAGKMVSGLARAAQKLGAMIFENAPVEGVAFDSPIRLQVAGREVLARRVLFSTNAQSLELSGLAASAQAKFTLVLATEPVSDAAAFGNWIGFAKTFLHRGLSLFMGKITKDECGDLRKRAGAF